MGRLHQWQQNLQNACKPPMYVRSLHIGAASRSGLSGCVLWALRYAHECDDAELAWSPPAALLPDVFDFQANCFDSFLSNIRVYSLGAPEDSSSGPGVERGAIHDAIKSMVANDQCWGVRGRHFSPLFRDFHHDDVERLLTWKVYGSLCGLFVYYFGRVPPSVSPFLILAVIGGQAAFRELTKEDIMALDPDTFKTLKPWLAVESDDEDIPTGPSSALNQMSIELTGKSVRFAHSFFSSFDESHDVLLGEGSCTSSPLPVRSPQPDGVPCRTGCFRRL